ncbi:hypothetical protein BHE74_00011729 [Ensete ventricosum]|nr:hypothetical protein BHE74_00011729 [Ensete ventricosum]RZR88642.1 hypothetical protein BHM03_00016264 [Ensete ventricosum]
MRAVCYQAVPPKIDCWRSISVIDRRLREKKERRSEKYEEEKRKKYLLARAPSSLARRPRSRVACASSPHAGRKIETTLPR